MPMSVTHPEGSAALIIHNNLLFHTKVIPHGMTTIPKNGMLGVTPLSVVKAGYSRKCMFLRPTLHPSICNGAILVSQVPMMTLLVVYADE